MHPRKDGLEHEVAELEFPKEERGVGNFLDHEFRLWPVKGQTRNEDLLSQRNSIVDEQVRKLSLAPPYLNFCHCVLLALDLALQLLSEASVRQSLYQFQVLLRVSFHQMTERHIGFVFADLLLDVEYELTLGIVFLAQVLNHILLKLDCLFEVLSCRLEVLLQI